MAASVDFGGIVHELAAAETIIYGPPFHGREELRPLRRARPAVGGVRHVRAARPDRGSVHPLGVTFAIGVSLDEEVSVVGFADKLNNKVRKLRGRLKRNVGEVTGDRNLQAAGRAEEVGGDRNRIGEKIKDAFRGRGRRGRRHN